MSYQDIWLNGKLIEKGTRDCEGRYGIIRRFCQDTFGDDRFSVCDVGAASCYFGLRLREDFPLCSVVAFEPRNYLENSAHLASAKAGGLILFGRKLMLAELPRWADFSCFDLVLAMSLLHHVKPGTFTDWVSGLRGIGRHFIAELSIEDSRAKGAVCHIPEGAMIIGHGKSHIDKSERPIILMKGRKS